MSAAGEASNGSPEGEGTGDSGEVSINSLDGGDVLPYENWAAALAVTYEPIPEDVQRVMEQVFGNEMLLEIILEKIIEDTDRAAIRNCRLVSRAWLCAIAKSYRKMKKPQFVVNTNKDGGNLLPEPRPRPFFEQHTVLLEFIKPMTRHDRIEGFIPTFALRLGPSYFRKCNYNEFVNCIVQCGFSLVELHIKFPKNSAMSFLLPPGISLPNLNTLGVSFSGQSLLGHNYPVPYHHQHDYFPNHCTIHLVQSILNAASNLRTLQFMSCSNPVNPPDLENLYLPDSLASVLIDTPLREFELLLRKNFPCLTHLRLSATIALYSEESIYELFSKLSGTLRTITLTGAPGTRRSLPIRIPRMEYLSKFEMYKPWEFEERSPPTSFEEIFPNIQELIFANQTEYSFTYMMSGMRSTTLTSLTVWLTSIRAQQPLLNFVAAAGMPQFGELPHIQNVRLPMDAINRRERRIRQIQQRLQQQMQEFERNEAARAAGGAPDQGERRALDPHHPFHHHFLNFDEQRRRYLIRELEQLQQIRLNIEQELANPAGPQEPGLNDQRPEPAAAAGVAVPVQPQVRVVPARRALGGMRIRMRVAAEGDVLQMGEMRDRFRHPYLGINADDNQDRAIPQQPLVVVRNDNVIIPDEDEDHPGVPRLAVQPMIHHENQDELPLQPIRGLEPRDEPNQNQAQENAANEPEQGGENPPLEFDANFIIGDIIGRNVHDIVAGEQGPERGPPQVEPQVANDGQEGNNDAAAAEPQNRAEGNGEQNGGDQAAINLNGEQQDADPAVRRARAAYRHRQRNRLLRGLGVGNLQQIIPQVNLPDRPVTMNLEKMQSINLAFPNLTHLTINICGPLTCGLKYIFEQMTSLQMLRIIVVPSLWKIKWDSILTGIPEDFCEAVKSSADIWDEVYLNENHISIRRMTKLETLILVQCIKDDDPQQSVEESQISDVTFHFALLKMKALRRLTVTSDFAPSKAMYKKWYEEKGYRIKTLPKRRLDSSYYDQ